MVALPAAFRTGSAALVRAVARHLFASLLAIAGGSVVAHAAGTYYVDNTNGNCSNGGPGTQSNPYCSISAAITAHNGAGTTILVMPGVYREAVTIPASGASGSPFVIQASGGTVVIDGADDFANPAQWAPVSGTEYVAASVNWTPLQVFSDGQRLTVSTAASGTLTAGTFEYLAGSGLHVSALGW